mgnify:CR=1 FL=1
MSALQTTDRRPPFSHRLTKIWRPALYQDGRKSRGYFEGWYFKFVDAATQQPVAVIPSGTGSQGHDL